MNTIHIITRCTRLDNILKIKESVFSTDKFSVIWHITFDTSSIMEIDSTILSELNDTNTILNFTKGIKGDFGHQLINKCIDKIDYGYVYVLDDDNFLYPSFYDKIYQYITDNPDKLGFIFNQKVDGKDFTGLDIRLASPENTKVRGIDMAQFLLNRTLISNTRIPNTMYIGDGIYIEEIFNRSPDDFLFIDEVLCYYNYFTVDRSLYSMPRVLIVGTDQPFDIKSQYIADFEAQELNTMYIINDTDIDNIINTFNPDCILTIGDDFTKFPKLSTQPYDVRKRWLHFNEIVDGMGEAAYQCANNFILSKNYNENHMISFFTPIYNTGDKLYRTYESLSNQTYNNWEWIVVNDSTDGCKTLGIAESIAKMDSRVKVYDFRKKSGGIVGESKYRAASLCTGKYIMEMDHDDYLLPEAGYWMIEAFNKYPDAKFVYSDCVEIDENHNSLTYGDGFSFGYGNYRDEEWAGRVYKTINTSNINPKTIRHIVGVPNHFRAWDRVFYHSIGGHNRRLTIADDYELIVRTFLNTRMVKIPKLLYLQFYHDGNTQNLTRRDIQRRVRSISSFYNKPIKDRFVELGYKDWAYDENPENPLYVDSKFGEEEGYVNYILNLNSDYSYNMNVISNTTALLK